MTLCAVQRCMVLRKTVNSLLASPLRVVHADPVVDRVSVSYSQKIHWMWECQNVVCVWYILPSASFLRLPWCVPPVILVSMSGLRKELDTRITFRKKIVCSVATRKSGQLVFQKSSIIWKAPRRFLCDPVYFRHWLVPTRSVHKTRRLLHVWGNWLGKQ